MNQIGKCITDVTGLTVKHFAGVQYTPSWAGLPILVGGVLTSVASVESAATLRLSGPVGPFLTPVTIAPNRETIYQAFFNLVKQAPGIVKASRVPQMYGDVDPTEKPFLFVEQMGENAQRPGKGMPYNWQLDVVIGLFVYSPDPNTVVPVTLLNPILDSIEQMLAPSPTTGQGNTLDGLVYEARLLGNGHEAAGAIGQQAWAYVPARIFVV